MLIAELTLPSLFNSIRCNLTEAETYYASDRIYAHFCEHCQQVFLARFNFITIGMTQVWSGDAYYCPACGKAAADNERRNHKSTVGRVQPGEAVPRSIHLRLYEFKQHLRLTIDAPAIIFLRNKPEYVSYHRVIETFTFDVKQQKTYFKQRGGPEPIEKDISNPFDKKLRQVSLLRFLRKNSRAWRHQKSEIMAFLKKLREVVSRKLLQVKGYRLQATHIHGDLETGLMLHPIQNLIWRLAVPDGPNLQGLYKCPSRRDQVYPPIPGLDPHDATRIEALCGKGLSYPQAVLKTLNLPDTKAGRRMLAGKPFYAIAVMRLIAESGVSVTGQKQLYDGLMGRWERWLSQPVAQIWRADQVFPDEKALSFFKIAWEKIGEKKALKLLIESPVRDLSDAMDMYAAMDPATKEKVWQLHRQKKTTLHDICTDLSWSQSHPDYNLNVPEPIINRLMMQKDQLRFYLPETYYQLHEAGRELHNCVGGAYPQRVREGECCIVLVADDWGKLKVCIELRGTEIHQAKLINNQPVWKDTALLNTVLAWAEEKHLTLACRDLIPPAEEPLLRQAG